LCFDGQVYHFSFIQNIFSQKKIPQSGIDIVCRAIYFYSLNKPTHTHENRYLLFPVFYCFPYFFPGKQPGKNWRQSESDASFSRAGTGEQNQLLKPDCYTVISTMPLAWQALVRNLGNVSRMNA
jgi:hypothetical protein